MIHYKKIISVFSSLLILGIALPVFAEIRVTVDRNNISIQDSVQLTIQSTNGDPSDLDLSPISLFFDIAQRSSGTNVSIVNGSYSKTTSLQLLLLPKNTGQFIIPPFDLAGESSKPVQITVVKTTAGKQKSASNELARVELSASSSSIRVQQQLIVTLRLYYQSDKFIDGVMADIKPSDSILEKIEEQTYQDSVNGIAWQVLERRYAVYPHKSGRLIIPEVRFDGSVRDKRQRGFFRQGRAYRARSNALKIEVLAPAYTDKPWLPAENLTVTSRLDQNQVRVGEPATRIIELRARGQVGEQLPEIPLANVVGGQTYQDKSEINNQVNSHGIDGIRTETIVIIPERLGEIKLPEQKISWWDNRAQSRRELTIPSHSIKVLPALLSSNESQEPSAPEESKPSLQRSVTVNARFDWINITLFILLAISVIVNFILWYRKPRQYKKEKTTQILGEQQAFTHLQNGIVSASKDNWQQLVNQWLSQIGEKRYVSTRQLISLLRISIDEEEKQDLETFRKGLDSWLYEKGDKPDMKFFLELCKRIRQDHGYPKSYSVPGLNI